MARPLRIEYENAFYHIIQRGLERREIFSDDHDKKRFLSYIDQAHTAYEAVIHTYILMDNHYHLILETPRANLSKIMHYLNTSYAAYYNVKHRRRGPLYQGRFKAILVEEDEYLHHLSGYIHLNPVRAKITTDPKTYTWSSYKFFTENIASPKGLNTTRILSMFNQQTKKAKRAYGQFVIDGIGKEKDIIKQNTHEGFILGTSEFVEGIIDKFIDGNSKQASEMPIARTLANRKEPTLSKIKDVVSEHITYDERLKRRLCLYLSRKYTQKTLNEIAAFYGKIKDTGVSRSHKKTEQARQEDKKLNKLIEEIGGKIEKSRVET